MGQKSLEIWATNLTPTVGVKSSITQLAMVQLAPCTRDVIVGLLLSDGWLSSDRENARLGFKQCLDRYQYVFFVFNILSHYCSSSLRLIGGIRSGNRFYGLQFCTRAMPCLTELHSLLGYADGVEIVPQNIYELLTPVALAHIIMGDGSVQRHGLIICTNSYSIENVVRLVNVLIIRYRLECKIREFRANKKLEYTIYIREGSMPLLWTIVKPYMHPSMWYKLREF